MVSSGIIAFFVAVAVQAATAQFDCGCPPPPPACPPPPCDPPKFEEGCCPGPVIEKKYVVNKPVSVPYSYNIPTYDKKCYTQPAGVDKKVIPSATVAQKCDEQITVIKVPTTDIQVKQEPLCKKTCTTSEYLIQIPIVETTCTCSPLCKKTIKTQQNLLTTTASKTTCDNQYCTTNKVVETPLTQTVCQDYAGCITKTGCKTVLKPEVKKTCVQLPPYKCLKPVTDSPVVSSSYPPFYPGADAASYGPIVGDYPAPAYPAPSPLFVGDASYSDDAAAAAAAAAASASASYGPIVGDYPAPGPVVFGDAPDYPAPDYSAPVYSAPAPSFYPPCDCN